MCDHHWLEQKRIHGTRAGVETWVTRYGCDVCGKRKYRADWSYCRAATYLQTLATLDAERIAYLERALAETTTELKRAMGYAAD